MLREPGQRSELFETNYNRVVTEPNGAEPSELPAGVPSARSNAVILWVVTGVVAIPLLGLLVWMIVDKVGTVTAPQIGQVSVSRMGEPVETKLMPRVGKPLIFALETSYDYSGGCAVILNVSLLSDGKEVASTECTMKSFGGVSPAGNGHNTWYGNAGWTCELAVPQAGANSVRVTVRKGGSGTINLSDTQVFIKQG